MIPSSFLAHFRNVLACASMRLALFCLILSASDAAMAFQQPAVGVSAAGEGPFRFYRVPFDSVTRLFPPGTELESIRYDEFLELARPVEREASALVAPSAFLGSVEHEIELRDGALHGVTRFEPPGGGPAPRGFRILPPWLDAGALAAARMRIEPGGLFADPEGRVVLDARSEKPAVRWLATSPADGPARRFSIPFPIDMPSRLELRLPPETRPASDKGAWVDQGDAAGGFRRWAYAGPGSPAEIRLAPRIAAASAEAGDFDADSTTAWTVDDDQWSGVWKAALRSSGRIGTLDATLPVDVVVAGCFVDDVEKPFDRSGDSLKVPIGSSGGSVVKVRVELRRLGTRESSVAWPAVRPLKGRWLIDRCVCDDFRKNPFRQVVDSANQLIPASFETLAEPPRPGRRLRFDLQNPGQQVTLRAAAAAAPDYDAIVGEMLVRDRARYASFRLVETSAGAIRPGGYYVRSPMRLVRVESYRTSPSGQRSTADFEIETKGEGFVIRSISADLSRGPLIIDVQLADSDAAANSSLIVPFPVVEPLSAEGRGPIRVSWSILTDDPRIRLEAGSARAVQWLPVATAGNRPELPGLAQIAPRAKPLAAWSSETGTNPELTAKIAGDSEPVSRERGLRVLVGTSGGRQFRSIEFETTGRGADFPRELADKTLAQAVAGMIAEPSLTNFGMDSVDSSAVGRDEPKLVRYRLESLPASDLPRALDKWAAKFQEHPVETVLVTDFARFAEALAVLRPADRKPRAGIDTLARASVDFLKANRWLPARHDISRCEIGVLATPDDYAKLAAAIAAVDKIPENQAPPPVWSEPVALVSRVFADGSARHRLSVRIAPPHVGGLRVAAGAGCEIVDVRLDGQSIACDPQEPGKSVTIDFPAGDDRRDLLIEFETARGVLEGTGFPLSVGLADVATEWSVASDDGRWAIATGMPVSPTTDPPDRQASRPFRTSFGQLGRLRLVRIDPGTQRIDWVRFGLGFLACWVVVSRGEIAARAAGWPAIARGLQGLLCLAALLAQPGLRFMLALGLAVCLAALIVSGSRAFSRRGVAAAAGLAALAIVPGIAAQSRLADRPLVVALPYDAIASAFAQPDRAILAAADLRLLRERAMETGSRLAISPLVAGSARHGFEWGEAGSIRLNSKYQVESTQPGEGLTADAPIVVPMAIDDALQVRAWMGKDELPVRVDRAAGKVELRLDQPVSGELTIVKTYPALAQGTDLAVTILPAIRAELARLAEPGRAETSALKLNLGDRKPSVSAGQELLIDMVRNFRLSIDSRGGPAGDSEAAAVWFTAVRAAAGIELFARIRDETESSRTLTLASGVRFLDGVDCESTILPGGESGESRVRIVPNGKSWRVRMWIPLDRAAASPGSLMSIAPGLPGNRAVVRLAATRDVSGQWLVASASNPFQEDPFEQESAAIESDSRILETFEVADWRNIAWRFESGTYEIKPQVEGVITLEDHDAIGRFSVSLPVPGGSAKVQESEISFDPATIITGAEGPGLVEFVPDPGRSNVCRVRFAGGTAAVARFAVRTKSQAKPALPGESAEASNLLPWPRFGAAPLVAGNLIVERRIDPESTYRASPMRIGGAPIESLGEIRLPETPADVRQWLYRFRGAAESPSVGWQLPGVFCDVRVEHDVTVHDGQVQWQCGLRYEPKDGPLSSMFLEVVHPEGFPIALEPDWPGDFKVDRTRDATRTRFYVRARSPIFGLIRLKLQGESNIRPGSQFTLPGVTPLGHGRVEKSVVLHQPSAPSSAPEIATKGMTELAAAAAVTDEIPPARTWKFRAAEADWSLRFAASNAGADDVRPADRNDETATALRDIAFEAGDDGFVLWYATTGLRALRLAGLPLPDSLGDVRAFAADGSQIALQRSQGTIHAVDSGGRKIAGDCLLTGRFALERLPEWLRTVFASVEPSPGRPINCAVRTSGPLATIAPGSPTTLEAWLSASEAGSPSPLAVTKLARLRRYRDAWFELPTAAADALQSPDAEILRKRSVDRAASRAIDDRIIAEPGRWRFFRYDGSPAPNQAVGMLRLPPPPVRNDALRRAVVALSLAFAMARCRRAPRTQAVAAVAARG